MPVVQKYNLVVEVAKLSGTNESGKETVEQIFLSNEVKLPILLTDKDICSIGPVIN